MKSIQFVMLLLIIVCTSQIYAQKIPIISISGSLPNSYSAITDADNNTCWQSADNNNHTLTLDVGSSLLVKYLALSSTTNGAYTYAISASNNNQAPSTTLVSATNGSVNQLIALNTTTSYRYFQVLIAGHVYGYPDKINNIELYASLSNSYNQLIVSNYGIINSLTTGNLSTGPIITGNLNVQGLANLTGNLTTPGVISGGSLTTSGAISSGSLSTTGNMGIGCVPGTAQLKVVGTTNPAIEFWCGTGMLQIGLASTNGSYSPSALAGDAVIRKLAGTSTTNNLIFSIPNTNNDGKSYFAFEDAANGAWFKI